MFSVVKKKLFLLVYSICKHNNRSLLLYDPNFIQSNNFVMKYAIIILKEYFINLILFQIENSIIYLLL